MEKSESRGNAKAVEMTADQKAAARAAYGVGMGNVLAGVGHERQTRKAGDGGRSMRPIDQMTLTEIANEIAERVRKFQAEEAGQE